MIINTEAYKEYNELHVDVAFVKIVWFYRAVTIPISRGEKLSSGSLSYGVVYLRQDCSNFIIAFSLRLARGMYCKEFSLPLLSDKKKLKIYIRSNQDIDTL